MNKVLKYLAAAIFIIALAINVKVTLDDPFAGISTNAIATGTTGGTTGAGFTLAETHILNKENGIPVYEMEAGVCEPVGPLTNCTPYCRERYDKDNDGVLDEWLNC